MEHATWVNQPKFVIALGEVNRLCCVSNDFQVWGIVQIVKNTDELNGHNVNLLQCEPFYFLPTQLLQKILMDETVKT